MTGHNDALLGLLEDCTKNLEDGKPFFMRENEEGIPYCKLMDSDNAKDLSENYRGLCGFLNTSEKVWAGSEVDEKTGVIFKSVRCYAGCDYCKRNLVEQMQGSQDNPV
jgi:hypothetical protein